MRICISNKLIRFQKIQSIQFIGYFNVGIPSLRLSLFLRGLSSFVLVNFSVFPYVRNHISLVVSFSAFDSYICIFPDSWKISFITTIDSNWEIHHPLSIVIVLSLRTYNVKHSSHSNFRLHPTCSFFLFRLTNDK